METEKLLKHRMLKFRKIGGFQEGIPIDPTRKVNMKKKEKPALGRTSERDLEGEVEKLKEQILKAKESSSTPPDVALKKMIGKLQNEIDKEFSVAVEAMGLKDTMMMLRKEFSRANSEDQPMHPALMEKIEKLKDEFNQGLVNAPNYARLRYKLDMLNEFAKAKSISEKNKKSSTLKQGINKKFTEVMDRPDLKKQVEAIKDEVQKSGASNFSDLDEGLKEKIVKMKKEVESEVINALNSLGLDVEGVHSKSKILTGETDFSEIKDKMDDLNEEINKKIEDVINSSELKNLFELLKLEVAKAGNAPNVTSKSKIEALQQQIKQKLSEVISSSELKDKYEELKAEISETIQSSEDLDGNLKNGHPKEENSQHDESRVEVNVSGNRGFA